jgi:hypothetical protein
MSAYCQWETALTDAQWDVLYPCLSSVPPEGLEPPTLGLEVRCSIQLS